ncbi:MAG: hypothetical protein GW763_12835 [Paraglaciecola sp.]|nr:hypothetical protein [Paraglaciecola sp.]NCT48843.1 hypothetical protein [Paraglaciecola sp.]
MRQLMLSALLSVLISPAFALYDSKPLPEVAALQGQWQGTLIYNDYSAPGKLVTLQTTLFAALSKPNEIIWHLVFDDGPNKTIYSYERMQFDFNAATVVWTSGADKPSSETYAIIDVKKAGELTTFQFEVTKEAETSRYFLVSSATSLQFTKYEIDENAQQVMRNQYQFERLAQAQ